MQCNAAQPAIPWACESRPANTCAYLLSSELALRSKTHTSAGAELGGKGDSCAPPTPAPIKQASKQPSKQASKQATKHASLREFVEFNQNSSRLPGASVCVPKIAPWLKPTGPQTYADAHIHAYNTYIHTYIHTYAPPGSSALIGRCVEAIDCRCRTPFIQARVAGERGREDVYDVHTCTCIYTAPVPQYKQGAPTYVRIHTYTYAYNTIQYNIIHVGPHPMSEPEPSHWLPPLRSIALRCVSGRALALLSCF